MLESRRHPVLCTAAGAVLTCASLLGAASLVPAKATVTAGAATHSWRPEGRPGLTGPIGALLADAPARGPVRVVTVSQDANGHPQIRVVVTSDRTAASAAIVADRADSRVLAIGIDGRGNAASPSSDPLRASQWAMSTLRAETAWSMHTAVGQVVAVVDSGVEASHPDLAGVVLPGAEFLAGNGTQTSGDGRSDANGHGTHVAGIIAAVANNGVGVAGLAQGATILPVRVLGADNTGWTSDFASGILWAADHGAQVINLSLGSIYADSAMAAAVSYAQSKDVVVVASAGNFGAPCTTDPGQKPGVNCGNPVTYPAAYPGVLAVSASDSVNASAPFTETGSYISLDAPGVSILSTYHGGVYQTMNGTSMASPYVAATAALVRAAAPRLSATAVANDLTATATDLGAPGRDDVFGAGLVNPVAALAGVGLAVPTPAPTPTAVPTPPSVSPANPTVPPTQAPGAPSAPSTAAIQLRLSTSRVTAGAGVSVVIDVTVSNLTSTPLAGPVSLCTSVTGGPLVCSAPRASNGILTVVLHPQRAIRMYAQFLPPGGAVLTSRAVQVQVAPGAHLTGGHRALRASLTGAHGQLVAVQLQVRHGWKTVATRRVSTTKSWTVSRLAAGRYRLSVPAVTGLLRTVSGTVTVRD